MSQEKITRGQVFDFLHAQEINGHFPLTKLINLLKAEYPATIITRRWVGRHLNNMGFGKTPKSYLNVAQQEKGTHYSIKYRAEAEERDK